MGHTCTHGPFPGPGADDEHPVVAVLAVLAIVLAVLLIAWVRLEVHGTADLEAVLAEPAERVAGAESELDAAVSSARFATGFAP